MGVRYACDVSMKYCENELFDFFQRALNMLGFKPLYFDVFFDEFTKMKHDLKYDEKKILQLLNKKGKPGSIKIKNNLYGEGPHDHNWFHLTLNIDDDTNESVGKTYLFTWSNESGNLDFLLNSDLFKSFIQHENFIYCHCYNQTDVANQSDTHYNKYSNEPLADGIKIKLNEYGDKVIDISKNWGRIERVRSISFVAAPVMWFGEGYSPVLSLDKLQKFRYARSYVHINVEAVCVTLFGLYENPASKENREKQKEYWDFLTLGNVIKNYEKNNEFDFTKWLKKRAKRK